MSFSLLNTSLYGRILMFVGRNWMFGLFWESRIKCIQSLYYLIRLYAFPFTELAGINSEQRFNYMDGFQCGIHVNNTRFCDGIGLTFVDFSMKRAYKGKEGKRFKLICPYIQNYRCSSSGEIVRTRAVLTNCYQSGSHL